MARGAQAWTKAIVAAGGVAEFDLGHSASKRPSLRKVQPGEGEARSSGLSEGSDKKGRRSVTWDANGAATATMPAMEGYATRSHALSLCDETACLRARIRTRKRAHVQVYVQADW